MIARRTDVELEAQFGWSRAKFAVDLEWIDAAGAAAGGKVSYLPRDPNPEHVFEKTGRVFVLVSRSLIDLRRRGKLLVSPLDRR